MKSSSNAACLVAFLSVFGFEANAAATEWHPGPSNTRFAGKPEVAATAYLKAFSSQLALGAADLRQLDVHPLRSLRTVRFEQQHHGLPVFGSLVAVRVAPDGSVRTTTVDIARKLTVSPLPSVDEAHAVSVVAGALGHPVGRYEAELGVRPNDDVGGILVWHVDVMVGRGMHRFVVDAHRGRLLFSYPMSRNALGRVYAVNSEQTPTLIDAELIGLNDADPSHLDGFELGLSVYGYKSGDINYGDVAVEQDTVPNSGGDFLYEPSHNMASLEDPFGEVMTYYHAARMRTYFESTFGLDMTGSKYSLAVVASYAPSSTPEYIENAFYTPWVPYYGQAPGDKRNAIFLGRGNAADLAYDSDVLLHEYTHYVNRNAMKFTSMGMFDEYGYLAMPDAINEGSADYFSSTLNDDPVVGEVALSYGARDLTEPAGRCPDNVYGESHEDGKLIGTAGWALRSALGAETADQLMWGALSLLGGGAALGDVGDGIMQTAVDLGLDATQVQTIESILSQRGLDACGRSLPLQDAQSVTTYVMGLDILGQYFGYWCDDQQSEGYFVTSMFQFEYAAKGTEDGVRIGVDLEMVMGGGQLDYTLYVRRGEMVTMSGYQGYDLPEVTGFDYKVENIQASHGEIVIDDTSNPPFDPTQTYYALMVTNQCPMVAARVMATPLDATVPGDAGPDAPGYDAGGDATIPSDGGGYDAKPPTKDGGDAGTDTGATNQLTDDPLDIGGGCGCRAASSPAGNAAGAAIAALIAAFALRRRPSRSPRII